MINGGWSAAFLVLNSIMLLAVPPQTGTTFQIGAWGDDSSKHNLGVQAAIETHAYDTYPNTLDYFWVGDNLADGSFVQFGYSLEPGSYCLKGELVSAKSNCFGSSELIPPSDARWQWQYWPNRYGSDFYYEIGPAGSAGINGTWHVYTIRPGSKNSWDFLIDGQVATISNFTVSYSEDPAFVVAERSATSYAPTNLGPVEFRSLSYLNADGWQQVDSLIALSQCGASPCNDNPYGVTALYGTDSLLAGSNVPKSIQGALLWTSGYVTLDVNVHTNTQFYVTSLSGTRTFVGRTSIELPKGMLASVSLSSATTNTPGPLGLIGAKDRFQEWTGDVNSKNQTLQVLMLSNKTVRAEWATDATLPTVLLTVALAAIAVLAMRQIRKRVSTGNLKARELS